MVVVPVLGNPWGELTDAVHVRLSHWNFWMHSYHYDDLQSFPSEMNSAVRTDNSPNSMEARNLPLAYLPSYSHCRGNNQALGVVHRKAFQIKGTLVVVAVAAMALVAAAVGRE